MELDVLIIFVDVVFAIGLIHFRAKQNLHQAAETSGLVSAIVLFLAVFPSAISGSDDFGNLFVNQLYDFFVGFAMGTICSWLSAILVSRIRSVRRGFQNSG